MKIEETLPEKPLPLVQAQGLVKHFPIPRALLPGAKSWIRAVDGIDFDIPSGETMALVGESGSGKTTVGRLILGLIPPTRGVVRFEGQEVNAQNPEQRKIFRRKAQMIFQDPFSALDPQMRVGIAIEEGLRIHQLVEKEARYSLVHETLQQVGLNPDHARRFPHELSGGQRQRVVIARALVLKPTFLIADEPVSALDVSIQAQVLNLLQDLQGCYGLTYLLISHDISIVEHMADRIAVMYMGEIVEQGPVDQTLSNPCHPYTQMLLAATPSLSPPKDRLPTSPQGELPSLSQPPPGCRFHPRCPSAIEGVCNVSQPKVMKLGSAHHVACWLYDESPQVG
jgi:oligopeptide/dipeptide ABC transporter ATP-binding protein